MRASAIVAVASFVMLAGCNSSGTEVTGDTPGPSLTCAPSLGTLPRTITSESLRWEVVSPSVNIGPDGTPAGTDHRLTLAVVDEATATWLLQTRIDVLEALSLQQALEASIAVQEDRSDDADGSSALELEVLSSMVNGGIYWTVEETPGSPGVTLVLRSGDSTVATVTMGVQAAARLQRRIGGRARMSYGQGILSVP
jgi:hypothetical protein